ncbi:MAG: AIR synthase-related protein [Bryobacteraceae bacterium]
MPLAAGKLPPELLRALLATIPADPSVVVGGAVGEDAAIIDAGGPDLLAAKTDPITFASAGLGRYLLAVNSNDLAAMGARPRWLLATVLLPEGCEPEAVRELFDGLRDACAEAGVALVGGHTEITVGLDRPIAVGCLLGTVARGRVVRTAGARPGDALLLAGGVAVEGAAILAREHAAELGEAGVDPAVIARAAAFLREPGISVLPAARAIHATGAAHAMHDPTEGGVATALHEIAEAAGVGVRVAREAIAVLPECAVIAAALDLDPLGLLASGALLAAVPPEESEAALARLRAAGVAGARIGEITASGRVMTVGGREMPLPVFERDELARYLSSRLRISQASPPSS